MVTEHVFHRCHGAQTVGLRQVKLTLRLTFKFYLLLGNIDQKVYIHNLADRKTEITHAHRMSSIVGLDWLKEDVLVSAGADGSLKQWKIAFN